VPVDDCEPLLCEHRAIGRTQLVDLPLSSDPWRQMPNDVGQSIKCS
jgi:hypothetical protein